MGGKPGYFMYLCSLVDHGEEDYSGLLRQLHNMEMSCDTTCIVDNDHNRIQDGINLRTRYDNEYVHEDDDVCSVLEFLIALAFRIEDVSGNDYVYSFWEMIENLGLIDMDDSNIDPGTRSTIDDKIAILLNREYSRDGIGGLFPLDNAEEDQRKVEIWYQMQAYLIEKYL